MPFIRKGFRLIKVALKALGILFVISLLWGRILPLPSTLIIGDLVTGSIPSWRWVSIDAISPALTKAIIASEDQRFCSHWGVDFIELQAVLADRSGPSRGASTLSMQVAKIFIFGRGARISAKRWKYRLRFLLICFGARGA